MAEGFKNFFIDHVPVGKIACRYTGISHCFLGSLARVVKKILVYSHNLYCRRVAFEDHQKPQETVKPKKL